MADNAIFAHCGLGAAISEEDESWASGRRVKNSGFDLRVPVFSLDATRSWPLSPRVSRPSRFGKTCQNTCVPSVFHQDPRGGAPAHCMASRTCVFECKLVPVSHDIMLPLVASCVTVLWPIVWQVTYVCLSACL